MTAIAIEFVPRKQPGVYKNKTARQKKSDLKILSVLNKLKDQINIPNVLIANGRREVLCHPPKQPNSAPFRLRDRPLQITFRDSESLFLAGSQLINDIIPVEDNRIVTYLETIAQNIGEELGDGEEKQDDSIEEMNEQQDINQNKEEEEEEGDVFTGLNLGFIPVLRKTGDSVLPVFKNIRTYLNVKYAKCQESEIEIDPFDPSCNIKCFHHGAVSVIDRKTKYLDDFLLKNDFCIDRHLGIAIFSDNDNEIDLPFGSSDGSPVINDSSLSNSCNYAFVYMNQNQKYQFLSPVVVQRILTPLIVEYHNQFFAERMALIQAEPTKEQIRRPWGIARKGNVPHLFIDHRVLPLCDTYRQRRKFISSFCNFHRRDRNNATYRPVFINNSVEDLLCLDEKIKIVEKIDQENFIPANDENYGDDDEDDMSSICESEDTEVSHT